MWFKAITGFAIPAAVILAIWVGLAQTMKTEYQERRLTTGHNKYEALRHYFGIDHIPQRPGVQGHPKDGGHHGLLPPLCHARVRHVDPRWGDP